MADETVNGAKETPAPTGADALTPPVNDGFNHIDPSVDAINDVDGRSVKGGEVKDAKANTEKTEKADAKDDKKEEVKDGTGDRYDKDPAWQRIIKERDEARLQLAEATGKLSILTPKEQAKAEEEGKDREDKGLPYKDITKMSKEELLEWQEDDPVAYAANLYQQFVHEAREQIKSEQAEAKRKTEQTTAQEKIKETFDKYEKENPDFRKMWDSGEIQKVIEDNPGIGAIGAHMKITEKARIDAAVAKAVKETEAKVIKNFQAKRNAEVITDHGTVKDSETPDELKKPDKYGGVVTVGALRLQRMRQQASGG